MVYKNDWQHGQSLEQARDGWTLHYYLDLVGGVVITRRYSGNSFGDVSH